MSQFRKPVMFSWNQPGRYERGQWQPGARVEREIEASVQPMSMQDIADMPEGERHGQMVKTYFDDDSVPIHQLGQGRIELTHAVPFTVKRGENYDTQLAAARKQLLAALERGVQPQLAVDTCRDARRVVTETHE